MNINHALNVISDFSIGESLLQVEHIVIEAQKYGYQSVALCDTMSIHNLVDFSTRCKKAGIKSIVSCRIRVVDMPTYRKPAKSTGLVEEDNPLVMIKVYIKEEKGIASLLKLLSKANSKEYFYYHARVGWSDVLEMEGVAISTGDFYNLFHHAKHNDILQSLQSKFGDDLFIEMSPINTPLFDTLNKKAAAAARLNGIKTVATYPFKYRDDADASTLDVLGVITSQEKMATAHRPKQYVKEFGFRPPIDIAKRSTDAAKRIKLFNPTTDMTVWREALINIDDLASRCAYTFEKYPVSLPVMSANEFETLGKKCIEGWKKRFAAPVLGHMPSPEELPKYKARLGYELGILKKMGFAGYFLLVEDLVMWAKSKDIHVGPGRGSCFLPGSRVCLDKSGLTEAIEQLKIGDKVLAHDGSTQEVIATLQFDRDEEIMELEFSNGVRIECTKDHKFFTKNRGWVVAEELSDADEFDDVRELKQQAEFETPSLA